MSMATNHPHDSGFGSGLMQGTNLGVGLPVEAVGGRPLVIVHPAAGAHHHASFGLVADADHPFIHVCMDLGEYTPDGWTVNANEAGFATYQRLADTTDGHKVYRKANLRVPHWQIHQVGEAYAAWSAMPPVDVMYADWLSWLEGHGPVEGSHFANLMAAAVHKVREGGLVVLDHKHVHMAEGVHPWFANTTDAYVHLGNGSMLVNQGLIEWMSPNLYGEYQTHAATVYKVHHGIDGPLSTNDWEEAMAPWFWKTVPEASLSPADLQSMLANGTSAPVHPHAMTHDAWFEAWARQQDEHEASASWLGAVPPAAPWPQGAYAEFLAWLEAHPHLVLGKPNAISYRLLGEAFTLHIVHGDLLRLAPALYGPNTALAVRETLRQRVVGRDARWLGQTLELQSSEPWMSNPVKGLQWSGKNATPHLAKRMLELAKSQPFSELHPGIKTMQVNHIVTVSHGTGSLGDVMRAVMAYYDGLPPMMGRAPMEMTVVCLDEDDCTDIQTVPPQFQFLPDDGLCADGGR
jgi:hypothetical protein